MRYGLKTPCANCPFRGDNPFPLRAGRVEEIWTGVIRGGQFPCHKTVDYSDDEGHGCVTGKSQMCAGAMILMMKEGVRNLTTSMADDDYDMDAPVYDTIDEMIETCERTERGG